MKEELQVVAVRKGRVVSCTYYVWLTEISFPLLLLLNTRHCLTIFSISFSLSLQYRIGTLEREDG